MFTLVSLWKVRVTFGSSKNNQAWLLPNYTQEVKYMAKLKDADVGNRLEDTERGKGKLGRSERVACTYIYYQM